MNAARNILIVGIVSMWLAAPAAADWDPGDGHKMHFPQLPDEFGWDVQGCTITLADDWECSRSGPVEDIHLWGSIRADLVTLGEISSIHVSIHDNIAADPDDPFSYSHPGALLWEEDFDQTQFTVRDYTTALPTQGWYDPAVDPALVVLNDHSMYHQINIVDIEDPYIQQDGTIYWLDISVTTASALPFWGWKTSDNEFMDAAVWAGPGTGWQILYDPTADVLTPLDFAFVITPEPGALVLIGLGAAAMITRRRRRR